MQREYQLARALSAFPEIRSTRIAFADSGVIPWFTGALWLDVAGLNDTVIARERDLGVLRDHFFGFAPDLVIHPGQKNFTWVTYGHGPLGDYSEWSSDPRWDDYEYVGTVRTAGDAYDLQLLVRRSSSRAVALSAFLRERVVDGRHEPFPYALGTGEPPPGGLVRWVPRPPAL